MQRPVLRLKTLIVLPKVEKAVSSVSSRITGAVVVEMRVGDFFDKVKLFVFDIIITLEIKN